jgi:predicted ATP-grasp superfamily ATP-dependent carboligase
MWELANVQEWDQLDDIPYPCILKPALIHLAKPYMKGKKLFIVDSRDDLQALVKRLPPETGSWLVQEVIPGEESRITLMAGYTGTRDVANDAFTARKLRQYPPGFGSASRVISETCDETRSISEALMHAIGFIGVYGAEFKRDPRDGILKIIEINPRPALWFYLSHAAGKQLVERAYCELVGLPLPERNKQRDGIVWQYALKDFVSSMFYRFRSKEFILGAPDQSRGGAVRGRCWPVFSLTDPMPFFAELGVYLIKYFRRLF